MWVRFEKDFRFKPTSQTSQHYRAGMEINVPEGVATVAMQAGAAVALKKVKGKSVPETDVKPAAEVPSGS